MAPIQPETADNAGTNLYKPLHKSIYHTQTENSNDGNAVFMMFTNPVALSVRNKRFGASVHTFYLCLYGGFTFREAFVLIKVLNNLDKCRMEFSYANFILEGNKKLCVSKASMLKEKRDLPKRNKIK